jgi:hypothetical protein
MRVDVRKELTQGPVAQRSPEVGYAFFDHTSVFGLTIRASI